MQNHRIIYASKHDGINFEQLDSILSVSRRNNQRANISGALIVSECYFLQVLEGSRSDVAERFLKITQDRRHQNLQIISAGDVGTRLFPSWEMHQILTVSIKDQIISRFLVEETFNPMEMSETAILDLCFLLSTGNWEKAAA